MITSLRKTISCPPFTGRRKWACSEWRRLPCGASRQAALTVRASPMPPNTTSPGSGVRATHVSPRRSWRSSARKSSIAACCRVARSVTSPAAELGRALLDDRPHRLLPVLAVQAGERVADLVGHAPVDVVDERRSGHQVLGATDRQRGLGRDRATELQEPLLEPIPGDDLGHEPEAERLGGLHEAGFEQEPERRLVADDGGQGPGEAPVR